MAWALGQILLETNSNKIVGLKTEVYVDSIRQWWFAYQFDGTSSFILAAKLKILKNDLKFWNIQSFSDIGNSKKLVLEDIRVLERI